MTLEQTAREIAQQKLELDNRIEWLKRETFEHYKILVKHHPDAARLQKKYSQEPDRVEFDDCGVTFFAEYNAACNCHPEDVEAMLVLLFEDMDKTPQELDERLTRMEEEAKKQKQKVDREKRQKEFVAQEKRDRELYEQLKSKFG